MIKTIDIPRRDPFHEEVPVGTIFEYDSQIALSASGGCCEDCIFHKEGIDCPDCDQKYYTRLDFDSIEVDANSIKVSETNSVHNLGDNAPNTSSMEDLLL